MKTGLKIVVLSARFAISGVPLAQLRFSKALASTGHQVDFLIGLVNHGYEIPKCENINVIVLNKARVTGMLMTLVRYFRETKPDVIFSAGDHLNAVVLMAAILSGSKAKISCSSRVTPFDTYSNIPFSKRWILKLCMHALMQRANALTCVSSDMVDQYKVVLRSNRHVCVYNIIDEIQSCERMNESVDDECFNSDGEPILIAAGSLVLWKGFSDLLLAMNELTKTRKTRLIILGDGPLRAELEAQIKELSLEKVVKILGYVENPLKYFKKADIFVLSSYVEGMPNVLVEAMMCGCTPVSTNCPTGPRELLQNGKYGYLVPVGDTVAMAEGIKQALDKPISEDLLREAVRPFAKLEVLKRHFEILDIHS
jgi:glycosyltransferase involved in cell wall biosynthesis